MSGFTNKRWFVSTDPYGVSWNGSLGVPTKDALYDKIETIALAWSVVATNTNAANNNGYLVDCSAASRTITLPATPTVGHVVRVVDHTKSCASFNIVIARNGEKIDNVAEDLRFTVNGASIELVYSGSTRGWIITSLTATV